jgi:iron complex outermembrane receptor protein
LSIDYTAKSGAVFYASYNKGYRTGGLSPLSSDPSQPPLMGYNPEFSDNIELGYKQRFLNNRIYMNLVAYYTKVSNAQVPTLILPDAITVTKNTGALSSKGIEAEITTIPFKGLNIQYILGLTDASYTSLNLSQQSGAIDLSGKRPLFTPSYNSALTIQYTYAFPKKNISAYVRSTMKNMGNTYFDLKNTIQQNPYTLVNASMGLNVNKISFEIWSKNCFNQNYIAYAFDFGAIHLGNPALFGVTLTTKF